MRYLILLTALMPALAWAFEWDDAHVRAMFDERQLEPIEGVWQFPADGATIAIVKDTPSTYSIYLIDSPYLHLRPGISIGNATATPKRNYYDGQLKSSHLGKSNKLSSQSVTFTVTSEGTLSIKPYKTGYSLSFKRWLRFLGKITIIDNTNRRPNDLNGARRIYPSHLSPTYPVCL